MVQMAQQVVMAKTKMLKNKQSGFSLIELLIVLLIAGILLAVSTYSLNLVSKQEENVSINLLRDKLSAAKHTAQIYNFEMRLISQSIEDKQTLIVQVLHPVKQVWQNSKQIPPLMLTDANVQFDPYPILIKPNGFITPGTICIDEHCTETKQ